LALSGKLLTGIDEMVKISAPVHRIFSAGATLILLVQNLFCGLYMLKPVLSIGKDAVPSNFYKNISISTVKKELAINTTFDPP
jgi:hypothetical protein